jgi:hypothetical protein
MDLDFYTREITNQDYVPGILEVPDEVSQLIIQIETCLFTSQTQVIGQEKFGINLEDLIFTFSKNQAEIKSKILDQIYMYCPLAPKYNVDVDVVFINTELRDVCLIDIYVEDKRSISLLM